MKRILHITTSLFIEVLRQHVFSLEKRKTTMHIIEFSQGNIPPNLS